MTCLQLPYLRSCLGIHLTRISVGGNARIMTHQKVTAKSGAGFVVVSFSSYLLERFCTNRCTVMLTKSCAAQPSDQYWQPCSGVALDWVGQIPCKKLSLLPLSPIFLRVGSINSPSDTGQFRPPLSFKGKDTSKNINSQGSR